MSKICTAVALFCLVLIPVFPAGGSTIDRNSGPGSVAFLARGPLKGVELPFIYPNALITYKGYYRLGEKRLSVIYTPGNFIVPDSWALKKCGGYSGYSFSAEWSLDSGTSEFTAGNSGGGGSSHHVFLYRKHSGRADYQWSVFIIFPGDIDCSFLKGFLKAFLFFQRDNDPDIQPLLPAVIELP